MCHPYLPEGSQALCLYGSLDLNEDIQRISNFGRCNNELVPDVGLSVIFPEFIGVLIRYIQIQGITYLYTKINL